MGSWVMSISNLAIYGLLSLIFSLVIGFLLAALMDQKIRFENAFRTIFLYPFALSFIVTGLVWQWILNPDFGVQSLKSRNQDFVPEDLVVFAPALQDQLLCCASARPTHADQQRHAPHALHAACAILQPASKYI
eukprot:gene39189-biopygen30966